MKTIEEQVEGFLKSGQHNAWLKAGPLKVYVRRSVRFVHGDHSRSESFEIANISIAKAKRGQGKFKEFIAFCEKANPFEVLFVENVMEPWFAKWFEKNGWLKYTLAVHPPSFYKVTEK